MARVRMVTRTIINTEFKAMALDVIEGKVYTLEGVVSGTFDNNDALLKAVKKAHETPTNIIATITESHPAETLYGMTEVDFMKYAKVLPPRAKQDDTETE